MKKHNIYQNQKRDFTNIVANTKQFKSLVDHLTVVPDDQKQSRAPCPIKQVNK